MTKVKKVLLLLKNMVYESTSPQETLKFAKYYRGKGLDVLVILWGPMGVLLAKKDKCRGSPKYDPMVQECLDMGVEFKCCQLASDLMGLKKEELIPGIGFINSKDIAELFLKYSEENQLIINL
ncbi:MAG: DsrE family protein [Methanosarcinaceae archaeon]|nr:DsrE family protein [Methanosarcinaceae archaeon]MDD4748923.1 DsrE family protein [Methanosarcinaceae archaeon]